MKSNHHLRCFLAAVGVASLAVSSSSAANYYWDDDGATPGFGTAGASTGTWAAPTAGPTAGWSESSTGANAFSSVTTASGDVLNFGTSTLGLVAGTITVSGTVTSGQGETGMTFGSASGNIVLTGGEIAIGTATFITVNNTKNTIQSTLSGTALTKLGSGTLELTGANTYTGTTAVNAGTLIFSGSNNSSGGISVGNGATLQLNSNSNGGLASGSISLSTSPGATLQAINADRTITNQIQLGGGAGVVSGSYSITQTSNGLRIFNGGRTLTNNLISGKTLTLNSIYGNTSDRNLLVNGTGKTIVTGDATSFVGTITVSGGTLILNGNSSTSIVNANAALGGTGAAANATFNDSSIFAWNLGIHDPNDNGSTTLADTFAVGGTLTDGGSAGGSVFKVLLAGSQSFADTFWNANQSWSGVLTATSGVSELSTLFTSFSYENANGAIDPTGRGSFSLSGTTLNWTSVPEPSSALLAGLLFTAGLLRRRRRA